MLDGFPSSQCPYFKDEIIKRFGNDDGFTDFVNNSKVSCLKFCLFEATSVIDV